MHFASREQLLHREVIMEHANLALKIKDQRKAFVRMLRFHFRLLSARIREPGFFVLFQHKVLEIVTERLTITQLRIHSMPYKESNPEIQ